LLHFNNLHVSLILREFNFLHSYHTLEGAIVEHIENVSVEG